MQCQPSKQCQVCGGNTQPETVLRIGRSTGRIPAARLVGWYCWTCKTSDGLQALPYPVERPNGRMAAWLLAAVGRQAPRPSCGRVGAVPGQSASF